MTASTEMEKKVIARHGFIDIADLTKANRKYKLAFSSGCFDLMHGGHFYLFRSIKERLDPAAKLVIAVHSDNSIQANKNHLRPILSEKERAEIIADLKTVDFVLIWDGWQDIIELVKYLEPDYLASTSDKIDNSNWENSWQHLAKQLHAEIIAIPKSEKYTSTSEIISRIQQLKRRDD
jgi:cytidyltransferase-like protein